MTSRHREGPSGRGGRANANTAGTKTQNRTQTQTIWLVGMMGAGKSALGPVLARRLGCRFVDTDRAIERASGRRIGEIFAEEGEEAFRQRERAALDTLWGEAAVVALGGGAIAQPGIGPRLASAGTVVYLRAQPETLLARVGRARGRPLLEAVSPEQRLQRLRDLLAARTQAYEAASLIVDTDGLSLDELAERIAARLEGRSPACAP